MRNTAVRSKDSASVAAHLLEAIGHSSGEFAESSLGEAQTILTAIRSESLVEDEKIDLLNGIVERLHCSQLSTDASDVRVAIEVCRPLLQNLAQPAFR